jgi:hypothetical protein
VHRAVIAWLELVDRTSYILNRSTAIRSPAWTHRDAEEEKQYGFPTYEQHGSASWE